MKTTHHTYRAVDNGADSSCEGCVFNGPFLDGCATHACDPHAWPEDDPLRDARNVIWINPQ
ncbi:hypothetical protein [Burkholderia oklahomensis]|uniref:Uncharacterized protein n=1 Tax=Burkholderia oklahomensis TaxID=342113 RepID=A0AAI8BC38_9BURK|nr:hypothetical protein [Burkholderia oklahomensis]AIO70098.1 hypothetical protein DM82_4342 [Burkholderia oklahomensis]AOI40113.1 hypothetical protein WG70_11155 [Burkholderia oklahomensis EO147]KUY68329.1 hypothetical protein WG70_25005 [Burkholderia oklahomensis EO147]QPS39517.1 hypothetical protein I6G57_27140 [Burkholderia oklahomensis]